MKRLSSMLLVVLALCLVLATASCGPTNSGKQTTAATTTAPTTTAPTTTAPTTTVPPAEEQPPEPTLEEKIASVKKELSNFRLADFGRVTNIESPYAAPTVTPTEGAHPRVLFTAAEVPAIKAALTSAENAEVYKALLALSETETDGKLADTKGDNADAGILTAIRAKALRYALNGEALYGYQALLATKHYLLTLNAAESSLIGEALFTAACVYDWCFSLTGVADQRHIIAGSESNLIPYIDGNYPPTADKNLAFSRDLFAFAIATADEQEDVYAYVAAAIESELDDAYDKVLALGSHPAGSGYGVDETLAALYTQLLWKNVAGAEFEFYGDDLERLAYSLLGYVRPGGEGFRIGDETHEGAVYDLMGHYTAALLAASLYDNADMRAAISPNAASAMDPILFLVFNDTSLKSETASKLPLVTEFGDQITVRSSWSDEDAYAVYMKIGSIAPSEHTALDAGAFQIYYKGALASGSGYYDGDRTLHKIGYTSQTVSVNSLLVFNPSKADTLGYAGGQSHEAWLARGGAKLLVSDYATSGDGGSFLWSYLATDLSGAYDADTVESAKRYMLASATGNAAAPLAFAVYDDITSTDASFKKTFLLHAQSEPTISESSATIVNGGGKLVVTSIGADVVYSAVGGDGSQYIAGDMNFPTNIIPPASSESGWGRLEISPATGSLNDKLLTIMYVIDAENTDAPTVYDLDSKQFVGAQVLGQVFYFSKSDTPISTNVTLTSEGEGNVNYYIAGLHAGSWELWVNGNDKGFITVEENTVLSITATAGSMTLVPAYASISCELNGGTAGETEIPSYYIFGKELVLPTDLIRQGFAFEGWYTTATFDEGTKIAAIPADATEEYSIYARWTKVYDSIIYELNGGIAGSEYPTFVNMGESLTLPTDLTLEGTVFTGWYLDPSFTGAPITEIPADHDAPITLYARFAKTLYFNDMTKSPFDSKRAQLTVGDDGIPSYDFIEGLSPMYDIGFASYTLPNTVTFSFDLGTVTEKAPAGFVFRMRPKESNLSDRSFFYCGGGKAYLSTAGNAEWLVADLSDGEMCRITLVISNDNAGLAAYKADERTDAVLTSESKYLSTITIKAYVNGVFVKERPYSTFLTFGAESFDIASGSKTCASTVTKIQYYPTPDKTPAGGTALRITNIKLTEHARTNGDSVFLNFGGGTTADTDYIDGNAIVKLPTAEKEGATFLGWYTTSEGDGDPVTSLDGLSIGIELYARYEATATE